MTKKLKIFILLVIILLAGFLRFYRYDLPDIINDEVFYGFRSIGLIDYLHSPYQPTPFEWYEQPPAWAKISFHDHPPLGFWIQFVFFKILGVNLFAMRFPFILAGIFSVFFVYLIAKRLFSSDIVGLLAAAVLAVNNYHIWISRIGLQESLVIFFILLAVWLFLKTLTSSSSPPSLPGGGERGREASPPVRNRIGGDKEGVYFYLTVAAIGLAILVKYTAVILIPIFFVYLLFYRRDLLSWKRLLFGAGILLVIVSPIIIYNFNLYQARGHFDFQFSYFLGQDVPEWQVRPGREAPGGFIQRFQNIFLWMKEGYGPLFSLVLTLSALASVRNLRKHQGLQFLWLIILFLALLLFGIGPENRFVAMIAPFYALLSAYGISLVVSSEIFRKVAWALVAVFLVLETTYSINTYHTAVPAGKEVWQYSRLRRDANDWGYNQLDQYLTNFMAGYYPEYSFPLKFGFAKELNQKARAKAKQEGKQPKPVLFVYDSRFFGISTLWYLTRRTIYESWPIITEATYLEITREDPGYFAKSGITQTVFIETAETLTDPKAQENAAKALEDHLVAKKIVPDLVKSPRGGIAFKIYKF